jgi:hypothetical protein
MKPTLVPLNSLFANSSAALPGLIDGRQFTFEDSIRGLSVVVT